MEKKILNIGALITSILVLSQVGIGTTNPEIGSILDVVSTNKGVLIPRLQLTSINDNITVPVKEEDAGVVIYNLENLGVSPLNVLKDTFYLWNGSEWESISTLDHAREVIRENNVSSSIFIGKPSMVVVRNVTSTYTPWMTIDFANEIIDYQNIHNTGTFTITETGLYSFSGGVNLSQSNSSGANKYYGARILLNDITVVSSMFGTSNGGSAGFIPLYWKALLNAGDIIQIQYRMRDTQTQGTFSLGLQSNINIIKSSH